MPARDELEDKLPAGFEQFAQLTGGSPHEYKVYTDLERRGFTAGVDFSFQADRLGGLTRIGNAKIHFFVPSARVAMRVQGVLWVTLSRSQRAYDLIQKLFWQGRGWFVADLLPNEIDEQAHRVVGLALDGRNTAAAEAALR